MCLSLCVRCVYVYVFLCVCVCIYVCIMCGVSEWYGGGSWCIYVSVCLWVCVSTCLYVCGSVCPRVCISLCPSACMSVCLSVCVCVNKCMCMRMCVCKWGSYHTFLLPGWRVIFQFPDFSYYSQIPATESMLVWYFHYFSPRPLIFLDISLKFST